MFGGRQPSFLISSFETVMERRTKQWLHGVRGHGFERVSCGVSAWLARSGGTKRIASAL